MQKITLYMGLNDKDTKKQEINTIDAYKLVMNVLTQSVDGGTIFEANGFYKHVDGTITIEKSLKIELIDVEENILRGMVETLKQVFNQESIILQRDIITSELI